MCDVNTAHDIDPVQHVQDNRYRTRYLRSQLMKHRTSPLIIRVVTGIIHNAIHIGDDLFRVAILGKSPRPAPDSESSAELPDDPIVSTGFTCEDAREASGNPPGWERVPGRG